jgi:hypothetical protein
MIVGRVFSDIDFDGQFSEGDYGIAGQPVGLSDGRTTYTDHNGTYMFPVSSGSYTVSLQTTENWDLTTNGFSKQVALSAQNGSSLGNDFGFAAVATTGEVQAELAAAPTRCGMVIPYWITVTNKGTMEAEVSATLELDKRNTFVWADVKPAGIDGSIVYWELGPMHPSERRTFRAYVALEGEYANGSRIADVLTAKIAQNGRTVHHATDSLVRTMLCEQESNQLTMTPRGYGAEKAIAWSQELTYTAHVENTTGDIVSHVLIEDTLNQWLDISSFEVLASSHDYRAYIHPDGVIQFYMENAGLVDSQKDLLRSQAFITYRIKPLSWVPNGEYIENAATYFMDVNRPVRTNTLRNSIGESISLGAQNWDALSETNIVYPNPTNGPTTFDLTAYQHDRVEIHLIDASGRVIFKHEMRGGEKHFFQLGALGKGNYLVRALPLETGEAELLTKLVVR